MTLIETYFVPNTKALGALDFNSHQNRQRLEMDMASLFFELHPSNLVRNSFFSSCKNTEIFVVISQMVSDLAKISVIVLSIS